MIKDLISLPITQPFIGFNNTDDELTLLSNMLVSVLNMESDKMGWRTRPGYTNYGTIGASTEYISGLYRYVHSDGNKWLLLFSETKGYKEATQGVFTEVQTGLIAGSPWDFITLTDLGIGCSSGNTPLKFDGTNIKALGITEPIVSPTVSIAGAGNLTGTYYYKITFVSAKGAETNGGPTSAAISPSSQSVSIMNIQTGGVDVTKRRIYRTKATSSSVFYLLDTLSDNTTTIYTDNSADTSLGTVTIPTNHFLPPTGSKFPAVYKEFLFVVDPVYPMRSYCSHQSLPEIFYTTDVVGYYLIIGLNDGQAIIGIRPLRETLFFFKEYSTWPVTGETPDDFKVAIQPTSATYGLYHRSIANVTWKGVECLVGLTKEGICAFDGFSYTNISTQLDVGINIQTFIAGLDPNALKWATGFNDLEKHQYRCAVREAGVSYNNKEIVWDYFINSITIFDRAYNACENWNENTLVGSSKGDGKIYQLGGLSDNGIAIAYHVEFCWWDIGQDLLASFKYLTVGTTLQGAYSPTLNVYVDGSSIATPISLAGGASWASAAWVISGGSYRVKIPFRLVAADGMNLRGRFIKVRISHSGLNQPMTVNSLLLNYKKIYRVPLT